MNMNISTIEDIIILLMRRDGISENEARIQWIVAAQKFMIYSLEKT